VASSASRWASLRSGAPTNRPTPDRTPDRRVPFIGLTGGIAAGKSTALEALERAGAAVLSTDRVVHELYGDDDVVQAVRERFGDAIERDGVVDRSALARVAFATPEDREWLEALLWPRVSERMAAWRSDVSTAADPPRAAVVEVPLLFESGMEGAFDATIAVIAGEELRAERAGARGHEALAERSARQLSQEEKAHRATYTVVNEGTVEELESKLSSLLEMLHS
jgi:dephospho-CoA kinase